MQIKSVGPHNYWGSMTMPSKETMKENSRETYCPVALVWQRTFKCSVVSVWAMWLNGAAQTVGQSSPGLSWVKVLGEHKTRKCRLSGKTTPQSSVPVIVSEEPDIPAGGIKWPQHWEWAGEYRMLSRQGQSGASTKSTDNPVTPWLGMIDGLILKTCISVYTISTIIHRIVIHFWFWYCNTSVLKGYNNSEMKCRLWTVIWGCFHPYWMIHLEMRAPFTHSPARSHFQAHKKILGSFKFKKVD